MPSRAIIAYTVRVYERGRKSKTVNLSEVGSGKDSLLKLFYGFVEAMKEEPDRFRDDLARRYTPITRVIPSSQIVLVEAEPGYYGLGGSTRDVFQHVERLAHAPGDSAGTPTRMLLTQAPDANVGLLFVERVGVMSAGSDMMDGFKKAFQKKYPDLMVAFEPIIEPDAWLASAALEEVIVVDKNFSTDIGGGDDETETKVVGRVEHVLRPPRGTRYLPHRVLQGLMNGSIHPEQVVNLTYEEPEDTDGVEVVDPVEATKSPGSDRTVKVRVRGEDGRAAKTFVLGNPRTPTVAYDFGDDAEHPSDPTFRDACVKLIPDLIGEEVDWKAEYHEAATWPKDYLDYRMELPPHGS